MKFEGGFLTQRTITPLQVLFGLLIAFVVYQGKTYLDTRSAQETSYLQNKSYLKGWEDCRTTLIPGEVALTERVDALEAFKEWDQPQAYGPVTGRWGQNGAPTPMAVQQPTPTPRKATRE